MADLKPGMYAEGSIKAVALNCSRGITYIRTGSTTMELPAQTTEWMQAHGYILNRIDSLRTIILMSRLTNKMAVMSYDGSWSGWDSYVKNSDLISSSLGTANLDSIKSPGNYVQTSSARATTDNHYPAKYAGYLEVMANIDTSWVMQRYTVYNTGAVYIRCLYDGGWYNWSGPK